MLFQIQNFFMSRSIDFQGPRPRRDIGIARPRHSKTCLETETRLETSSSENIWAQKQCIFVLSVSHYAQLIECCSQCGARPTEAPPPEKFTWGPLYPPAKWKVKVVLHRMRFSFDFAFHAYSSDF